MKEQIQEKNLSIVNRMWDDAQRRIVWTLICKARKGLKIGIDPIVATAFIILQKYFRGNEDDCTHEMFILMVAALFTSCKQTDESFRSMSIVYKELAKICKTAPSKTITSILGTRLNKKTIMMDENDLILVTNAEIDLLNASQFTIIFDLPFSYFNMVKNTLATQIPFDILNGFCLNVIVGICLMICSEYYLDIPPEVAAAAATEESFKENVIFPDWTLRWVSSIKQKYGKDSFILAQNSINKEKMRTIFK